MNPKQPMQGKILNHHCGLGVPTPETVRERASELSEINGHVEVTAADWAEAKRELHGGHELSSLNGEEEMIESASDWNVGSMGHKVPVLGPEDAGNFVEELIAEGMDEAVHEQMLEAARDALQEPD